MKFTRNTNAAWLYEKAYFKGLNWERGAEASENASMLKERNEKLLGLAFPTPPAHVGNHQVELETLYPGLLSGSGYPHEMGFEGELKLGFSFDYNTGLPYLPGSSVKGTLRSLFDEVDSEKETLAADILTELLLTATGETQLPSAPYPEAKKPFLAQLREEIFANQLLKPDSDGKGFSYEAKPTVQRDIFLDAFAVPSGNKPLIDKDYITPHINRKDPNYSSLTEPIPIPFVKVLPEVCFRFDFDLKDSALWPALTADKKKDFFKALLLMFGIGAKTRVGYGQFRDPKESQEGPKATELTPRWPEGVSKNQQREQRRGGGRKPTTPTPPKKVVPQKVEADDLPSYTLRELQTAYRRGEKLIGLVRDNTNKQLVVEFRLEGEIHQSTIRFPGSASVQLGTRVRLKVTNPGNPERKQEPQFGFGGYDR